MRPPAVCRSVTAAGRPSTTPASRALLRSHPNTASRKVSRMAVDNPGAKPARDRNGSGSVSTHCRTGTCGSTRSTRFAAVSAMRRPPQLGQKPVGGLDGDHVAGGQAEVQEATGGARRQAVEFGESQPPAPVDDGVAPFARVLAEVMVEGRVGPFAALPVAADRFGIVID